MMTVRRGGAVFQDHVRAVLAPFEEGSFAETVAKLELMTPAQGTVIEATLAALAFECHSLDNSAVREALDLIGPDMWAEGFLISQDLLKRFTRAQLVAALGECRATFDKDAKKSELVSQYGTIESEKWLPEPLRWPGYEGPGSEAWADRLDAEPAQNEGEAA